MSHTTQDSRELLSIQEVAELKNVHHQTVRRWIRAGRLPAYRVGGHLIRLKRADVDALDRRIPNAGDAA